MRNKIFCLLIAALLSMAAALAGCTVTDPPEEPEDTGDTGGYFSDGDFREAYLEEPDAVITLSGGTGTLSDSTRGSSGTEVRITAKGIYLIQGESDGVQIVIDEGDKSGNIYLIFDNVSMKNNGSCVYVKDADKVIFQSVGTSSLENTKASDGAIYSKDDISFSGSGTLNIISAKHGIEGNDDVVITGGVLNITSANAGIKANDSIRIGGGEINITSGRDGLKVDSDEGTGYFVMTDGTVTVDAGYDAVDIGTSEPVDYTGFMSLEGGTIVLMAGGGQSYPLSDRSQKGLKCEGNIYLRGASADISTADDGVHSEKSILIEAGEVSIACSDDGISADGAAEISGGSVRITKAYEGIDAESVLITGGNVSIVSSDDGINTSVEMGSRTEGISLSGRSYTVGDVIISGGNTYVNAVGDGIDSNNSIYIEGGILVVEGPSNRSNSVFDYGDGEEYVLSVTGGYIIATGNGERISNFNAGTQASALIYLPSPSGSKISVNDGSEWSVELQRSFACIIYSSPDMEEGGTYTLTSGEKTEEFTLNGLYYSSFGY